jgi:hypothetical protein
LPSPALTIRASVTFATSCGAPICGWRSTITSGSYAPSVIAVSFSDSPLSTADPEALIDIVSAESRFAGELEARRRPRRRLVEDADHEPPAQRRQLLHLAVERALEGAGRAEQAFDVFAGQVADRDQMPRRRRIRRAQVVPHHV